MNEIQAERINWENKILETGLFSWLVDDGGGRILKLNNHNLFLVSGNFWIVENNNEDCYVITSLEEILELISNEETQAGLLFHLDVLK